MRIAYVCADFGIPVCGHKGASVHVRQLVSALVAQGHDVRIFTPNAGRAGGNASPAPIEEIPLDRASRAAAATIAALSRHPRSANEARELGYNLGLYRALMRRFKTWRPDAVYERYSLYSVAGLAAARRCRVPHVLEVNAILRLERGRGVGVAFENLACRAERLIFGAADLVLTVSTALEHYVVEHGSRPDRTMLLPNGVDTERFRPHARTQDVRDEFGIAADALVIGFAGSLKPWHGTDVLLSAFAKLRATHRTAHLLVVGDGPQAPALHEQARGLGIAGAVTFAGAVEHDRMPAMLAAMDVGVAPYLALRDFYFSPLKVYEYMAAGLAIVASASGDIISLVPHGESALLTTPGDVDELHSALDRLASNPELRTALGTRARAAAARHTWDANARTVTTNFDALAGGRRERVCRLAEAGRS